MLLDLFDMARPQAGNFSLLALWLGGSGSALSLFFPLYKLPDIPMVYRTDHFDTGG